MITRDLFSAILSMDSYNRGYAQNVKLNFSDSATSQNEVGRKLGNATIVRQNISLGAQDSGFYAIAYDVSGAGIAGLSGTVISYRGTNANWDAEGVTDFLDRPLVKDALTGWIVGAGIPGGQANLAIDFYNAVVGDQVNPFLSDITTTGHSLGGGLAGYVATLYGKDGVLFDHMPYALAVDTAYKASVNPANDSEQQLRERIYGTGNIIPASSSDLEAFATTGEVLGSIRTGDILLNPEQNFFYGVSVDSIDSNGGLRDPVNLHSQALLVNLIWARDNVSDDWESVAPQLWDAFFNEEVAAALASDIDPFRGPLGTDVSTLQSAIAYSAIDEGERPFGDVAIRSMFDDAGDLGKTIELLPSGSGSIGYGKGLSEILLEFAGLMALRDVEADQLSADDPDVLGGVLEILTEEGPSEVPAALRVNFGNALWSVGGQFHEAGGKEGLIDDLIVASFASENSSLKDLKHWYENEAKPGNDLLESIDEVVFSLQEGLVFRPVEGLPGLALQIGTISTEDFSYADEGDHFLFAERGDDTVFGNIGIDILYGGIGDDTLNGGGGKDWLSGGTGQDTLDGGSGDDYLDGGEHIDVIQGGDGDDTIIASFDGADDHYDGGSGQDVLLYKWSEGNSTIRVEAGSGQNFSLDINVVGLNSVGSDEITQIEQAIVEAGSGSESLIISNSSKFNGIKYIDLGDQASGSFDTIDLRQFTRDMDVNLASTILRDSGPASGGSATLIVRNAEAVLSGVGDDKLTGDGERNVLDGGAGDDELRGAAGDDVLIGGAGEDLLLGGIGDDVLDAQKNDSSADLLNGGAGKDTLLVNDGDTIDGLDRGDRVRLGNRWLDGGERGLPPEVENCDDPGHDGEEMDEPMPDVYIGRDGTIYSLFEGTLTVNGAGGTITIREFVNGQGGIKLQTKQPDTHTAECRRDPLIIDLDNDGNVVTPLSQSAAYFDIDNDGFAEQVAWSTLSDGILVRDLNQNGIIDNGSELFGDARQQYTGGTLTTIGSDGFTALASLDSNSDGLISNLDTNFAELQVWIDGDGDGDTDEGELVSLDAIGIVSITLKPTKFEDSIDGISETPLRSTVALNNGSNIYVYDAYLAVDQYDTREIVDFEIDVSLADLPVLIAGGNLSDLDIAMTRDPGLAQMVREFSELDVGQAHEIHERVEAILLRWTGADKIAPDSRGININARWLTALEKFNGTNFNQASVGSRPRADAAAIMISEWHELVAETTAKLLGQTDLGQVLTPGLNFAAAAFFQADEGTNLTDLISNAAANAPIDVGSAIKYWHTVLTTIAAYDSELEVEAQHIINAAATAVAGTGFSAADIYRAQIIGVTSGHAIGTDNGYFSRLVGATGNDLLIVDSGISRVNATSGDNRIIVLGVPDSLEIIENLGPANFQSQTSNDVNFVDIPFSEVTSQIEITELVDDSRGNLKIEANLNIVYQSQSIARMQVSLLNGSISNNTIFNFDGGGSIPARSAVLTLLDGTIHDGKRVTLVKDGQAAASNLPDDQILILLTQDSQISFDQNSGHDILYASKLGATSITDMAVDGLRADIEFRRTGFRNENITISYVDGSASLEMVFVNTPEYDPVDTITFSDGETISASDLSAILNTGTTEADNILGSFRSDILDGKGGTDLIDGSGGADDYIFKLGYGNLTISDRDHDNRLLLGPGVTADDISFILDGPDLVLEVGSGNDTVRIARGHTRSAISTVVFDDGSTTPLSTLLNVISSRTGFETPGIIQGTIEGEFLFGTSGNEILDGRGGNDVLRGGAGNDTYVFGPDSIAIVDADFGVDTLYIPAAYDIRDLVLSGFNISFEGHNAKASTQNNVNSTTGLPDNNTADDIERIVFADGTEIDLSTGRNIIGTDQFDILFSFANSNTPILPGQGDDRIFLGNGNYIVKFEEAFGNDVIYGGGSGSSRPLTLDFNDFNFDADVSIERAGDDLIISLVSTGDSVTLKNSFAPFNSSENIVADFGNILLNFSAIVAALTVATDSDDVLFGRQVLDGGAGDDLLIGTSDKNEYSFGRGYGNDVIKEQDSSYGNKLFTTFDRADTLTLIGLHQDDVSITRDATDPSSIILTIKDTGETLTLDGSPLDGKADDFQGGHWIDRIIFADGSETSQRQIEQSLMDSESTDGNDVIQAFGYPANYNSDGGRTIVDAGRGNDIIKTDYRSVSVTFRTDSGNDEIIFTDNQDERPYIEINSQGQLSSDIAKLNIIEDGVEYIIFQNTTGSSVKFRRYNSIGEEVGFSIQSDDWIGEQVFFAGSQNFFGGISKGNLSGGVGVDFITGDFTPDPQAEVGSGVSAIFDEILVGGTGNDIISGNGGLDTVIFNIGDGFDTLLSNELSSVEGDGSSIPGFFDNEYIIQFGSGIDRDDIQLEWSQELSGYLSINVGEGNDGLLIAPQYLSSILFADGTTLELTFETADGATVMLEDDEFYALTPDPEIITTTGGGSELYVDSEIGNDTFQDFSFGEFLAGELDAVDLFPNFLFLSGPFVGLSDLEFYRDPAQPNDLTIYFPSNGSSLTVLQQFSAFNDPNADIGFVRLPVDADGDGTADWGLVDANLDGTADFAAMDSDGDGIPNWINPDFDGDGNPDWESDLYAGDTLDVDGDGQYDVTANQIGDEYVYSFAQPDFSSILAIDVDGDLIPDEYGIDLNGDDIADRIGTPVVLENIIFQPPFPSPEDGQMFTWLDIAPLVINSAAPSVAGNGAISLANLGNNPTDGADEIVLAFGEQADSLAGNDSVRSLFNSATLFWGAGDGNDVFFAAPDEVDPDGFTGISGTVPSSIGNIIIFQGVASLSDLDFKRGGNDLADLVVTNASTGERLTIKNQFDQSERINQGEVYRAVHRFKLEDGTTFNWNDIRKLVVGIDDGGDNELSSGNEGGVLDGGQGFDMLRGGTGDDIYVFGRDYDEDTIIDLGGTDAVEFLSDVSAADVFFSRGGASGQNLLIEVTGLNRLSMTISGQFSNTNNQIEFFDFADGTMLGWREVQRFILESEITDSSDNITGFISSDRIETRGGQDQIIGLDGDDIIDGGDGRDTSIYRGASDQYIVTEANGIITVQDTVSGRDGTDTLINVEDIKFLGDAADVPLVAPNSAPVTAPLVKSIAEDGLLSISQTELLAGATDGDGDIITLAGVDSATNGTAWIGANGNLFFRPSANFSGDAVVQFTIADGNGGVSQGNMQVAVVGENDAPVQNTNLPDVILPEDERVNFAIDENLFTDPDGDSLSLTAQLVGGAVLPSWLSFSEGRFFGKPPANFNGTFDISINADDGQSSTATQFSLTFEPINDAPIQAAALSDLNAQKGEVISFTLPDGIFSDPDDDALSFTATLGNGDPLPAWLSFDGATFIGQVPVDIAVDELTIRVVASDGSAQSFGSFNMNIVAGNTAPEVGTALFDQIKPEDTSFDIVIPAGSFVDVDGDILSLSAALVDGSSLPGWLAFDGDRFTGVPPQDFNGSLEIAVTASDGEFEVSDNFVLTIDPVNDVPVLSLMISDQTSLEDEAIDFAVPAGTFADVDGDALTLSATLADGSALPTWLNFDGERFTGQPPQDFNGLIEIQLTASDGEFAASDLFALSISPVNDPPVVLIPLADVSASEDTAIDIEIPSDTFVDVDGDLLTLTATLSNGSDLPAWLNFDGARLTGTPPQDFNGDINLAITASDGTLDIVDNFVLTIDPVNDAPVVLNPIADLGSLEDQMVNVALPSNVFSDIDGDNLSLTAAMADGSDLPVWLEFDGVRFTGIPPTDFNGSLDIKVTADDGVLQASNDFSLTIDAVNDAPVIALILSDQSSDEDQAVSFELPAGAFVDVDGDVLTLSAKLVDGGDLPAWLQFDGSGFVGAPPQDFNGSLAIVVSASDGGLSVSQNFNLTINPQNDAPSLIAGLSDVQSDEDTAFDIALPANAFADVDGDALSLSATLVGGAALPTWIVFDGVRFTGTPPLDFNGTLEVEVLASDGSLSVADSLVFTINPVNDAPVAADDDIFLSEGGDQLTILQSSLLLNDTDVDGDILTVTSVSDGANGTVGFDVDGNVVYTPNAGFQGTDSFTYTVSDGALTSTATAQLRVDDPYSGWRQGTEGNDWLFGNFFSANEIYGRGGNDVITGGFYADYLAGGDGNDNIFGLFGNDHLWGNAGDDNLFGGFGTDTAYFGGTSSEYELQTQYGGFYVRTRDELPGVNGDDGRDQLYSIERLAFADQTISVASPIILDLDGDGIEVVSAAQSNALFDLDGDGVLDDTSWIGSGDAFLFLDRDGDGFVSGANEISFVDDAEEARSDLDGLRSFDSDGDSILSAADDRFGEFGVWQDLNTNGKVDAGETFTLDAAGIVSIDLDATATEAGFSLGDVAIVNQGLFTRADGSTGGFADAAITFFEQGMPELPKIEFGNESFGRKSKKYRLYPQNGELMIGSKKGATQSLDGATIMRFSNRSIGLLSPIILDLDGDGVEMRDGAKSSAWFDMDGNGSRDDTGWATGGDGFLVIDRNNNGIVDNGAELSFLTEAPGAKSDLQALSALDSNGDGIISNLDVRFRELKVWVDRNENGVTDAGELASLNDHGIASVNLNGTATNSRVKVGQNILLATSTFTRTNGSVGQVGDAALSFTPSATPLSQSQGRYGRFSMGLLARRGGDFSLQSFVEGRFVEPGIPFSDAPELTALRAGLNSATVSLTGQGLSFDVPAGTNVFDYYEQAQTAMPVIATISGTEPLPASGVTSQLLSKGPIDSVHAIFASPEDATGDNSISVIEVAVDDGDEEPVANSPVIVAANENLVPDTIAPGIAAGMVVGQYQGGPEAIDADMLKIALMTQDMSVFGASSAAAPSLERDRQFATLDYFAA